VIVETISSIIGPSLVNQYTLYRNTKMVWSNDRHHKGEMFLKVCLILKYQLTSNQKRQMMGIHNSLTFVLDYHARIFFEQLAYTYHHIFYD